MAGMEFEYDEKGGTFYYFLLSFLALLLIPATYYLWPRKKDIDEDTKKSKHTCHCEPCQAKRQILKASQPHANVKRKITKVCLILGWVFFLFIMYKVSTLDIDYTEYDPFVELGIDRGASTPEIKKAYRKLSKIYHPDKETGDPKKFMRIAKAYAALTDEESRKNWEEHGNPDGPGATQFGIALPKWIVEKQNSVWVLGAYALAFLVILPVVVGTWWYRSIKYTSDEVLLDTQQLFFFFFHKTPNMILKRVIMILSGAFEFEKSHNSEIIERESDNEEIPILIRDLQHTHLNEKNKERPLCFPYSVKTRTLLHSHFSRHDLPPKTLEQDKIYVIKTCPYLINEMVNTVAQLVALAHAGRVSHMPRLETVENCMKVSQMTIQALWDNKSPLLQLPHISEDMLRHFVTRKRNIRTIKQFASLKEEDRRSLLRTLSDDEYHDVINVCASMPHIEMNVDASVLDDGDTTITAGSIVTVTVELVRKNMEDLFDIEVPTVVDDSLGLAEGEGPVVDDNEDEETEEKSEVSESGDKNDTLQKKVHKPWEKQAKKKNKAKGKSVSKTKKKPIKSVIPVKKPVTEETGGEKEQEDKDQKTDMTPNGEIRARKKKDKTENSDDELHSDDAKSESDDESGKEEDESKNSKSLDDEDDWLKFQEQSKKDNSLETKSKESHLVHCPYFPCEKHEWWWLYVADRKNHLLISAPLQVCSLKREEEIQVKFSAPQKPGSHTYTVSIRSDSYIDFDITQNIKLDVKEAKKVESHPQWEEMSDDEDKDKEDSDESSDEADYDDSDE